MEETEAKNPKLSQTIIGIEDSGGTGRFLTNKLVRNCQYIYEVNPLFTKQRREYGTRRDKSDKKDAKLIAEVLTKKLGQLPVIRKRKDTDILFALKEMVRYYDDLVRQRTKLKNQIYFLFRQQGVLEGRLSFSQKRVRKWQAKFARIRAKEAVSLEHKTRAFMITQKLSQITRFNRLIDQVKEEMEDIFTQTKYQNLRTIKGVDLIIAAKIASESQGIERFANIDKFIAYAGLSPKESNSGKRRGHKKEKKGNRKLNHALHLLALSQLRLNPKAREYFEKKVAEGKSKKHALRCLAKRVTCIVYGMMRSGKEYQG